MISFSKLFSRLNITKIFKGYKGTFYNYGHYVLKGEKKSLKSDCWVFVIIPFFISVLLGLFDNGFMTRSWSILISCLSIFAALLFSFLTLVYSAAQTEKNKQQDKGSKDNSVRLDYIIEIFKQISFAIAISIISICILFILQIPASSIWSKIAISFNYISLIDKMNDFMLVLISILKTALCSLVYFSLIQFLLALFVILNRFYIMFTSEFQEK